MHEDRGRELQKQIDSQKVDQKSEIKSEIERLTELAAMLEKQVSIMETRVKEQRDANQVEKREVRKMQGKVRRMKGE